MQSLDETGGDDQSGAESGTQEPTRYLRSTIGFPYTGLKDAEQIARALHESWGGSASPDQLAASPTLHASPRSGAFRTKVATARTFRVIAISRGNIALTELGRKLVDPQTRAAARVEAFLIVPLFSALVNEYRGNTLPPDEGLEQKILDLGVSVKQTARARQAFQRSAELAVVEVGATGWKLLFLVPKPIFDAKRPPTVIEAVTLLPVRFNLPLLSSVAVTCAWP